MLSLYSKCPEFNLPYLIQTHCKIGPFVERLFYFYWTRNTNLFYIFFPSFLENHSIRNHDIDFFSKRIKLLPKFKNSPKNTLQILWREPDYYTKAKLDFSCSFQAITIRLFYLGKFWLFKSNKSRAPSGILMHYKATWFYLQLFVLNFH